MEINLEELLRQLSSINLKDSITKTPFTDIIKKSSNFKIEIITEISWFDDDNDIERIQLTFDWLDSPRKNKNQTWYIDLSEYLKTYRKNKIKKLFV